ncbi:MAG: hypothetical protein IPN23_07885 [Elusimicrobia bacterium]|nr:hypothetical protein [Elusimicrobiota bacterium]
MTYFSFSGALNFLTSTVVLLLVLARGKKTIVELTFILFSANIGLWSLFYLLWLLSPDPPFALVMTRAFMMGAIFIPFFYFHFIAEFSGEGFRQRRWIRGGYFFGVALAISNFGPWVVRGVEPRMGFVHWPIPGPLFHVHLALFAIYLFRFIGILVKQANKRIGNEREQFKYLLLGTAIGFGGGMTNYLLWYGIPVKPYGNSFVSIYVAIIAYTILRYRLMDINLAARNLTLHLFFGVIISIPAVFIAFLGESVFFSGLVIVLLSLLGPFFFVRFRDSLLSAVDRLPVFRGRFLPFEDLQLKLHAINNTQNPSQLYQILVQIVREVFGSGRICVLARDHQKGYFLIKEGHGLSPADRTFLSLSISSPIINFFESKREMLVKENIASLFPAGQQKVVSTEMNYLHAVVAVPIFSRNSLQLIVCLGEKETGAIYNDLDLAHLTAIARGSEHTLNSIQAGIMNEQMTAVWAHDLMKPFTPKGSFHIIKKILSGHLGPINSPVKSALELILNDSAFVLQNLGRLLHPGSFDDLHRRPVPLSNLFARIQEKFLPIADEAGVYLDVTPPPPNVLVICDAALIEHRVLSNLIENALRHTTTGGRVTCSYELREKTFVGIVRDTGEGIQKQDFQKVFERGVQLDQNTKGMAGLGLFSVKSVCEAHGGKVWFESVYGRGTTFYFELPRSI